MRRYNDTMIALGVAAFSIGLATLNVFFPWLVSAVALCLGLFIGYGALRLHFED